MLIHVNDIIIPKDRQRKDLGDIKSLANSIDTIGLISPIVVEPIDGEKKYTLIAGERRLTAFKQTKMAFIEATTMEGLSDSERTLVELEENIRRKQLSWQEEIAATAKYAQLMKAPVDVVAKSLGVDASVLSKQLVTAEALGSAEKYAAASSWTACYAIYQIDQSRKLDSAFEDMMADELPVEPDLLAELDLAIPGTEQSVLVSLGTTYTAEPKPKPLGNKTPVKTAAPFEAIQTSFLDWAPAYTGKRFNLIHCDFPYGLGMDETNLQNSAPRWDTGDGRYADSPKLFSDLCRVFFDNQDKFVADSAHCIFWLAAKNYGKIASQFAYYGWNVCEVPLIWHKSDNAGIAPDVRRWPRRTFEIAVFASRGDRKIVKVKGASYAGPTTKDYHLSEKPRAMLAHFFEMVCDSFTDVFDPTCGSGHALLVARDLGAKMGLGLDVVEDHVKYANKLVGG